MRALICRAWGSVDTLKLEDIPPPSPGRGQLVIDVKATGVNYADSTMVAVPASRRLALSRAAVRA